MMKEIYFNNAAKRKTYAGNLFETGVKELKNSILNSIESEYSSLHKEGFLHIHDLEAYGLTYNCLTPDIIRNFPYEYFDKFSDTKKILEIISYYKHIISNLANEQTGGIAFANFDDEIDYLFNKFKVVDTEFNLELLKNCIESFVTWINVSRTRYGQECYYVSLNLGLSTGKIGRFVTESVLNFFMESSSDIIRPNIIFKAKYGVNLSEKDKNYDLFCLALKCTAKKMIPTYLLCDSKPNVNFDPYKMAIMGCRTRVMQNQHGEETSIGRGNIDYVTINLPKIALEIDSLYKEDINTKISLFQDRWVQIAQQAKKILLDRYDKLLKIDLDNFPFNFNQGLWIRDFNLSETPEEVFKNGTLSIGFIGIAETIEILTGDKYYFSENNFEIAIKIVTFMRETVDQFRKDTNLNFTLLATSGEYVSGRFPNLDKKNYNHKILHKGYYTNSFHVDVDSLMHPLEKIKYEGAFHVLCNGGCITYVELLSAPLNNYEAIFELIEWGIKYGVSYLGINYPMDVCMDCGTIGTFDKCSQCGGSKIKRIRRVSGYLEDLEFFTKGKKSEVLYRKPNIVEE